MAELFQKDRTVITRHINNVFKEGELEKAWCVQKLHIPFSDGNKRIADKNLVVLTLMIAESRTEEKDVMVKVVVNLINQEN